MSNKNWILLLVLFVQVKLLMGIEYNLQTILQLADENNKDIKLARSNLQFASALKKEAISQALPQINGELSYNRNFLQNKFFFTVTDSTGQERTESFTASFDNAYQFNTTLNQTLFSFGKVIFFFHASPLVLPSFSRGCLACRDDPDPVFTPGVNDNKDVALRIHPKSERSFLIRLWIFHR